MARSTIRKIRLGGATDAATLAKLANVVGEEAPTLEQVVVGAGGAYNATTVRQALRVLQLNLDRAQSLLDIQEATAPDVDPLKDLEIDGPVDPPLSDDSLLVPPTEPPPENGGGQKGDGGSGDAPGDTGTDGKGGV